LSGILCALVAIAAAAQQPTLLIPSAHRPGLDAGIKVLAANPASSWFATLGGDETICIWDASDAHFLAKVPAKGVQSLAVLPHSHLAIEGDADSTIRLVDVDTFTTVKIARLDASVQWLQSTADGRVFAVTYHGLFRLDPSTLAATKLAVLDSGLFFQSAVLDKDGSAIGVTMSGAGQQSGRVVLYNARDGSVMLRKDVLRMTSFAIGDGLVAIGLKDSDEIDKNSGHILVLRTLDGAVENNIAVKEIPWSLLLTMEGGRPSIVGGFAGAVERMDVTTGRSLAKGEENEVFVRFASLSTKLIAAGTSGAPNLCDTATLRCTSPPVVEGVSVTQAKMLDDGSLLLMDTRGDSLRVGETVEVNKVLLSDALALIPEFKGKKGLFATDGSSANDPIAPTTYGDLVLLSEAGSPLAVSADGRTLAARAMAAPGKQITVDMDDLSKLTSDAASLAPKIASWKLNGEDKYLNDASAEFQFRFTPDSSLLIAVDTQTGSVHRYDVAAGRELLPVLNASDAQPSLWNGPGPVSAWSVSTDGTHVIVGRQQLIQSVPLDGTAGTSPVTTKAPIQSIAAGDGGTAFIALDDGSILRWDGRSQPALLATLPYPCTSLLYIPERKWIVANSTDGSVRFLDAATGQIQLSMILFANGKDWLLWTPSGLFDASDRGWQDVQWKFASNTFSPSEPMEDFLDDFYRPGLAASVLAGNSPQPPVLRARERRTPDVKVTASHPSPSGKVTVDVAVMAPAGVAIRDVHLSRNGVLLKIWNGTQSSGRHFSLNADLVAGENQFTAYAFNQDDVKSTDAVAEVTGPDRLKRAGELYVIAIGINDYRNQAFHLNYARQDALLAAAALGEQRRDIETFGKQVETQEAANGAAIGVKVGNLELLRSMGDAHITKLLDGDATRDRILKTIADVSHRAKPQDALIVFYAGHGVAVGDRYYLLPQDLPFEGTPRDLVDHGLGILPHSAISDLDLQSALSGEQASVAALILDSCQSGELIGDKLAERRGPMDSRGLGQMAYDKRMFILAASLSTQTAAEQAALGDGVLTYALMREGLVEDMASPERVPSISGSEGHGPTTLTQWLRWSANRVVESAADTGHPRGFLKDEQQLNAHWLPIQQPRLFAPPDSEGDVMVALHPINLDPDTMTATGYTESAPSPAAAPTHAPLPEMAFSASTLGAMRAGPVLPGGHQMLGAIGNRIVTVDLDHGAVLSRQPMGGNLISFDLSPSGEFVALDQSGDVSIAGRSSTQAPRIVVPGFGYSNNGLVRWLKPENQILAVTDKSIALYNADGKKIRSIDFPNIGVHSPVLAPAGDWLYLGDWSGKVLSYQVPSLTPGPVLSNASPALPAAPGTFTYVVSLVVDPAARRLIRIMNDGSFTEAQLPSLAPETKPLIHQNHIRAAAFSTGGAQLFVVDSTGTIQQIDTADSLVKRSWPAMVSSVDTLSTDAQDTVLVASGNGGLAAWALSDGKLRGSIPGGPYFTTAVFSQPGAVNVELAGNNRIRTFHPPEARETSSAALPDGLFVSQNRILGKTKTALEFWSPLDVSQSSRLPLPGDGQLNLTPDGRYLAWAPAQFSSGSLQVFETATGKMIKTVSLQNPVSAFALSPDGRFLNYLLADQLHIVPLSDSGPATTLTIPQAPCCVMSVSTAADRLLLASQQGQVTLYDLASKRVLRSIEEPYIIATAAFGPTASQVILTTSDGGVLLWNPSTTEEPRLLGAVEGDVPGIAFNSAGSTFLVSTDLGCIGWFSLEGNGSYLATTTWIESAQSWLTRDAGGRFAVTGDTSTPLGLMDAKQMNWRPAAQQSGYTPGLLNELLAK
jgi:WD40 repeat protein